MGSLTVLSLGGGWQSSALLLMACEGEIGPLDAAVFADTQREMPETYRYLDFLRRRAEQAGIAILTVTAGDLRAELISRHGRGGQPNLPVRVRNPDGSLGRVNRYRCSYDFKRRPVTRKVKQLCGPPGAWKHATVEQWIGYSSDEASRLKASDECRCGHKRIRLATGSLPFEQIHHSTGCRRCGCPGFDPWQINRWPLIELGMTRQDCRQWITGHGYPPPPRSACYFCPNRGNAHWRHLRDHRPALWADVVELDGFLRHGMNHMRGQGFLHRSGQPLNDAPSRSRSAAPRSDRSRRGRPPGGSARRWATRARRSAADLETPAAHRRDTQQDTSVLTDADTECDAGTCFT
jgi:hypothetical protein